MHFYPFHIGDYVLHTRHLTPMQDLVYRRMLDLYYTHERPLHKDADFVARQIGLPDLVEDVDDVLAEFFDLVDGQDHHNPRADREIALYRARVEAASRAGKASANARSTPVQRQLNERSTNVQPTMNHEPVTKNQEPPVQSTVAAAPVVVWDERQPILKGEQAVQFAAFWDAYGYRKAKAAAERAWKRIAPSQILCAKIVAAAKAYRASPIEMRKHPATWLNAACWEDEADRPPQPAPTRNLTMSALAHLVVHNPEDPAGCQCENCIRDRRRSLGYGVRV